MGNVDTRKTRCVLYLQIRQLCGALVMYIIQGAKKLDRQTLKENKTFFTNIIILYGKRELDFKTKNK